MSESFTRQLCLLVDVQGYGRGNDRKQSEIQKDLVELLDSAARTAGLNRADWEKQSTGDGELSLIPPSEPEARIVDRFMVELASLLYRRNCELPQHERLRLRLAVDHGPVETASLGFSGSPLVAVSRMVASAVSHTALVASPEANLVILLSQRIYKDLVIGGRTALKPNRFLKVAVLEKEFTEEAWLWVPGVDVDVLHDVLAGADDQAAGEAGRRGRPGPTPLSLETRRLQDLLPERYEGDADLRHTLEIFVQMVSLVDGRAPLTAYADADQIALAYVLAELSIVHGYREPVGLDSEFKAASRLKRDLEIMAESVSGVEISDLDTLRRLIDHASLIEPAKIKRISDLRDAKVTACFSFLWGLARLAQLLDNPCLVDPDAPSSLMGRRNVIAMRDDANGGLLVDLVTTDRSGFHLAAEAHHTVRRYFAELEDAWRRSHLIAPSVRFELQTPNWAGRSLQVHEIRVDPRPITRLLMGRALYGDRPHVWLRELIQNAVDATQMARQSRSGYLPRVEVELEDPHHVTIRDNGVGMTNQQVLAQLSVLGRSGWRDSSAGEDPTDGTAFFGRFGIGFASVFSVASSIDISTRTADSSVSDGIAVRFSGADRPFYTDFTSCPVGSEIRVSLIDAMDSVQFREALSELFAYLPTSIVITPDLRLPTSLRDFSALAKEHGDCRGWTILGRTGTGRLGSHGIAFKVELLHDPKPHKRTGQRAEEPWFHKIGRTSLTFCVDGVRVRKQRGFKNDQPDSQFTDHYQEQVRNLHLSGCYITIDFERNNAPLLASRNALNIDSELQGELENLVRREVAAMLPELLDTVQASCISGRDCHDAGYFVLEQLLAQPHSYGHSRSSEFNANPGLVEAAADVYAKHCPVLLKTQNGKSYHRLLADIDPATCSVATTESLTGNAVFPAFVRATGLEEWIVVSGSRELTLLENAWPHDVPLRVLDEKAQLYEDFQVVLPEIREGLMWSLLRADYALAKGAVFGSALYLSLPGRRGSVTREEGMMRRRCDASIAERPRIVLNCDHEIIRAIEEHLGKDGKVDPKPIQEWLDRFCKDVLDEKSQRVANVMLARLREQLTTITRARVSHMSLADLRVS